MASAPIIAYQEVKVKKRVAPGWVGRNASNLRASFSFDSFHFQYFAFETREERNRDRILVLEKMVTPRARWF